MGKHWLSVILLLTGQAAAVLPCLADGAVMPRRLVALYDFEEVNDQGVKLGRGLELPPSWYPIGRDAQSRDPNFERLPLHRRLVHRPGFPPHNRARYSERGQTADGSDYSLHLSIDGGHAGAYLEVGALPAIAGSNYHVTARVRTERLEHAGGADPSLPDRQRRPADRGEPEPDRAGAVGGRVDPRGPAVERRPRRRRLHRHRVAAAAAAEPARPRAGAAPGRAERRGRRRLVRRRGGLAAAARAGD